MPFDIYLIILLTLIALGILSLFKNIKEGFISSLVSGGILLIIFILHYIYYLINGFFSRTGITFKDILTWVICIAVTSISFILIIFFMKFWGIKKK